MNKKLTLIGFTIKVHHEKGGFYLKFSIIRINNWGSQYGRFSKIFKHGLKGNKQSFWSIA